MTYAELMQFLIQNPVYLAQRVQTHEADQGIWVEPRCFRLRKDEQGHLELVLEKHHPEDAHYQGECFVTSVQFETKDACQDE